MMKIGMEINLVQLNMHLPSITDIKLKLFEEMVGSFKNNEDFKIECQGETIGISKAMLQSLSDVFRRMTTNGDNKEAVENSVKIDDTDPETIKELKTFVLDMENFDEPSLDLLMFANKYNIKPVTEYCKKYITEKIDKDNILDVIKVAYITDADDLMKKSVEFLADNRNSLQNSEEWTNFQKDHPMCFVKMMNLQMFPQ